MSWTSTLRKKHITSTLLEKLINFSQQVKTTIMESIFVSLFYRRWNIKTNLFYSHFENITNKELNLGPYFFGDLLVFFKYKKPNFFRDRKNMDTQPYKFTWIWPKIYISIFYPLFMLIHLFTNIFCFLTFFSFFH